MSGRTKQLIDKIVSERSKGSETLRKTTLAKISLKGIDPDAYNPSTPDDPAVITRLQEIAMELGVKL